MTTTNPYPSSLLVLVESDTPAASYSTILAAATIADPHAPCVSTIAGQYEDSDGVHDALVWFRGLTDDEIVDPKNADAVIAIMQAFRADDEYDVKVRDFEITGGPWND